MPKMPSKKILEALQIESKAPLLQLSFCCVNPTPSAGSQFSPATTPVPPSVGRRAKPGRPRPGRSAVAGP